ncbi:Methyltransferase type 11 protein [Rutstroemia sp. NJR-2017a BVV2]|nr:Methyltransferase type 11 protein [Rutstroemia sp. NJR-2017a BVV2]
MSTTTTSKTNAASAFEEIGFSVAQGANWSEYLAFRPIYPKSFFERIYQYHSEKNGTAWLAAHDNGAGCGVVSSTLADRFKNVIVSDPNDGYATLAQKILTEEVGIPASRLRFLQEGAEKSSVESNSVDLVTACECIHWTDTAVAIKEFGRVLKTGGTVAITHYTVPRIVGNEAAQKAWNAIYQVYSQRAQSDLLTHAFRIINTGLDCLEFPANEWKAVKRIYINAQGSIDSFKTNDRVGESKVKSTDERVWVEDDADWCDEKDITWLKGYIGTWVPVLPESEAQDLWDELEKALNGQKAKLETPVAIVLATKS